MIILGRWVWRYLTERFLSQLFMTFTSIILAVFLITTVSFTYLLLGNVQNDALNNLATATNVLDYALNSKEAETRADAESIASSPSIATAITKKDHNALAAQTANFLKNKQLSSLVVTTADAQVLLRAEDPSRWGDSISSDTLVRRALIGTQSSTVVSQSGVLAPVISIRSVIPVRDGAHHIVGTISAAITIDNAFVDGLKHATGLDTAVYSGDVRSATTLTAPDGTSRWIGVKESNAAVQQTVLKQGKTYKGPLTILNRQYLAVYAPLKDSDGATVGMLFIGQPEISILQTATYLISLTFIVSVALLALAIVPAYLLARQISKQLE
jgi:methyl-accepting chemotaxis protein